MKWWGYGLLVITIPLSVLYLFQLYDQQNYSGAPLARQGKCLYKYINQNRCEPELAIKKREYVELRNDLTDFIEQEKANGHLTDAAIYFRDLQNGPVLGIDTQDYFIPASLLKLPLMITYLKKAETDPDLLKKKIVVEGDVQTLDQNIKPGEGAQMGKEYTREQLLTLLIAQSDNTSWKVLLNDLRRNYSEEDFIGTLNDLGIIDPRKRSDQQYVTANSYASLFRILYNSAYLNLEMSNKALEVLSQSKYQEGIAAGVPDNIQIAHKFGEQQNGEEQQLHDCGIVYYSPNPYIICVMTRGNNLSELAPIIQEVSRKVYYEVETRSAD